MAEYFKNVPYVKYEGPKSTNKFAFKFYDKDRVVAGKTMAEHLKFAMAWWHTLGADGTDMFGSGTQDKTFGGTTPMDIAKRKVDAGWEFMDKLGIDYFCFHDRDLAPEGKDFTETLANLNEIVDYIAEKQKTNPKKLLWGTSNCFGNPRFSQGAGTAPNADAFAFAAAQIKAAMDATVKLGGNGYVFWGGREGYATLLNTDLALEQDNLARLFKLAIAYADKIGFKGDFYIEPKPKEPSSSQYDFDTATAVNFLRKYDLMGRVKMNIEANHATLAGHTFEHEIRVAAANDVFGSIDANEGDPNIGWDVDKFPSNLYSTTFGMLEILRAGGFTNGGLNFDAKQRRDSFTLEDTAVAHILGMDSFAFGLLLANKIIEDGRIDAFIADRYSSWTTGIGKSIIDGNESFDSLSDYAKKIGEVTTNKSGEEEYLLSIVNQLMVTLLAE